MKTAEGEHERGEVSGGGTRKGYGAPVQKVWEARFVNESHRHLGSLYLLIQSGKMTFQLDGAGEAVVCQPGATIEVAAHILLEERVGLDGVTFLVASK